MLSWALGLAMFALGGGAQTASIVAFQFAPAALVAPLWLLRKPRPGPRAADGCHAVRWTGLWLAKAPSSQCIFTGVRINEGNYAAPRPASMHRRRWSDQAEALARPSDALLNESALKGILLLFVVTIAKSLARDGEHSTAAGVAPVQHAGRRLRHAVGGDRCPAAGPQYEPGQRAALHAPPSLLGAPLLGDL